MHRILHWPIFYTNIHKLHHTYKQPSAFSVTALHPIELVWIYSIYMSPLFLFPVHYGKNPTKTFIRKIPRKCNIGYTMYNDISFPDFSSVCNNNDVHLLPWNHRSLWDHIQALLVATVATRLYIS